MTAYRATVTGLVQGVGFRYWTAREARRLGIVGWARNLPGGAVEVLAQGDPDALEALAAWLGDGPSYARVSGVAREPENVDPRLARFDILS